METRLPFPRIFCLSGILCIFSLPTLTYASHTDSETSGTPVHNEHPGSEHIDHRKHTGHIPTIHTEHHGHELHQEHQLNTNTFNLALLVGPGFNNRKDWPNAFVTGFSGGYIFSNHFELGLEFEMT